MVDPVLAVAWQFGGVVSGLYKPPGDLLPGSLVPAAAEAAIPSDSFRPEGEPEVGKVRSPVLV